ncbi:hypothetical protein GLX28_03375 [Deinococcus xianganensis]|uniref:Uncharacterized protein n=1 Tax=Deinococcus xianganensis TaxID=1507289 RepID=A0A6I4Y8I5_9DEIO|nr:hypothetical protein [Deinococcus xianganensis]
MTPTLSLALAVRVMVEAVVTLPALLLTLTVGAVVSVLPLSQVPPTFHRLGVSLGFQLVPAYAVCVWMAV